MRSVGWEGVGKGAGDEEAGMGRGELTGPDVYIALLCNMP